MLRNLVDSVREAGQAERTRCTRSSIHNTWAKFCGEIGADAEGPFCGESPVLFVVWWNLIARDGKNTHRSVAGYFYELRAESRRKFGREETISDDESRDIMKLNRACAFLDMRGLKQTKPMTMRIMRRLHGVVCWADARQVQTYILAVWSFLALARPSEFLNEFVTFSTISIKRSFMGFDLDGWKHQRDRDPVVVAFPRGLTRKPVPERLDMAKLLNKYCQIVWGESLRKMARSRRRRRQCVFPSLSKLGNPMHLKPMTARTYGARLQVMLHHAGIPNPTEYTAGCGRSGGTTELLRIGVSRRVVQRIARWRDERMFDTYERPSGFQTELGIRRLIRRG